MKNLFPEEDRGCQRNSVSRRMLIATSMAGPERIFDGLDERIVELPLGNGVGHGETVDDVAAAAKHDFFVDHRLPERAG